MLSNRRPPPDRQRRGKDDKRHVFLHGATHVLSSATTPHPVEAGGNTGGTDRADAGQGHRDRPPSPGKRSTKAPPLLLEAMKMEHTITAPAAGTVDTFCYAAGEQVSDGAALVEFTAD